MLPNKCHSPSKRSTKKRNKNHNHMVEKAQVLASKK